MNVLVVTGHPRPGSFCAALAAACARGAAKAGARVETVDLARLAFDTDLHVRSPNDQPLEPDLEHALGLLERAEHIVFVYPNWWGAGPSRLRGFLDRVLLRGRAFDEDAHGRFVGRLGGRTAHLVVTLDMPPWVHRLVYRGAGLRVMRQSVLGFCGIETTRVLLFGEVRHSDETQRARWLLRAEALGLSLADGPRHRAGRWCRATVSWLRALRLQFYPTTWMTYAIGAWLAAGRGSLDMLRFLLGLGYIACVEAATVFVNDWFDRDSDRRNHQASLFTGGSRMLVTGRLGEPAMRRGIAIALVAAAACAGGLLQSPGSWAVPVLLVAGLVLGLGYTAPPLRLSWRGWGELDVAFTHSALVLVLGFLLQGGRWNDARPWLAALSIGLAVLPAILLAGVPDADADRAAGKRTFAVRFGARRAAWAAVALLPLAPCAAAFVASRVPGLYDGLLPWAFAAAAGVIATIVARLRRGLGCERIDRPMMASLAYIALFAIAAWWNAGRF